MPDKSYEELSLETQQVIDAAILMTEMNIILRRAAGDEALAEEQTDIATSVNNLRVLYAHDIQQTSPTHFDWHNDSATIVASALNFQQENLPEMAKYKVLGELMGLLDNLPYPQEAKGRGDLTR